ncbi:MAG: response regulator [Candidatus Goldbacteria bacterium]|nr:response regulator [Candidatus Goldiibacteriota bacterium]
MHKRYRVLIADDDKFIRGQLTGIITKAGHSANSAADSESALKLIGQESFDVLITDIYMEKMSGQEMIKVVKKMKPDMPVIAMTGDETIDLEREVRGLGVFAYFLKPIEMDFMLKTLEAAFAICEKKQAGE